MPPSKGFLENYSGIRVRATELSFSVSDLAASRPIQPPLVLGDVKVVATNVLNYFLTLTTQDATARGADSALEFERQAAKISLALGMMDADVYGLVEVQNSAESAADLAAKVTIRNAERSYVAVGSKESRIGQDAIRCDYIYDHKKLALLGYKMLDDADPDIVDIVSGDGNGVIFGKPGTPGMNRVPLAATFQRISGGENFTLIINHFKSKGSSCGNGDDSTEGAGNCNLKRTAAAKALLRWIDRNDFFTSTSNIILLGDLNAYAQETPVQELLAKGFTSPINLNSAYSYQFSGESGTLDYALVSGTAQYAADYWHVNADEPNLLGTLPVENLCTCRA